MAKIYHFTRETEDDLRETEDDLIVITARIGNSVLDVLDTRASHTFINFGVLTKNGIVWAIQKG